MLPLCQTGRAGTAYCNTKSVSICCLVVVYTWKQLLAKHPYCLHDHTLQFKITSLIALKVRGWMHGNETDLRTHLAHTDSELDFSVGLSSMIPCSSKRFNVARE